MKKFIFNQVACLQSLTLLKRKSFSRYFLKVFFMDIKRKPTDWLTDRPTDQIIDQSIHPSIYLFTFVYIYTSVTYPEFFWADWLHLRVPPPPFRHHGWRKFLNLVPPDALKMHSLAVPVLRFLCKTFSKLRKLNNETLFSVGV